MSTAEKIFQKAQTLSEENQQKLLRLAEEMAHEYPTTPAEPLTLRETAELRAQLEAWEEDWNAPGMDAYDRP